MLKFKLLNHEDTNKTSNKTEINQIDIKIETDEQIMNLIGKEKFECDKEKYRLLASKGWLNNDKASRDNYILYKTIYHQVLIELSDADIAEWANLYETLYKDTAEKLKDSIKDSNKERYNRFERLSKKDIDMANNMLQECEGVVSSIDRSKLVVYIEKFLKNKLNYLKEWTNTLIEACNTGRLRELLDKDYEHAQSTIYAVEKEIQRLEPQLNELLIRCKYAEARDKEIEKELEYYNTYGIVNRQAGGM